jgi:Rrf2 family transcriptional regulator, nitric oxide-sensitive transcriptional repressor
MRLNAFSDVCLRAMMLLAAAPEGELLTSQAIADGVGTPYNHVSKAIIKLRELGLVEVTRGRTGGAALSSRGRTATVGWLLRELNERPDVVDCESVHGNCPLSNDCGLRAALRRAREAFYRELDDLVIASLPTEKQMEPVFVTLLMRRPG